MKNFKDYLSYFLEKRNLYKPDGRPLYAYKISDSQYQALRVLLSDNWENSLERDGCFVLYAVEFLRREFEGHLRWNTIFDSLNRQDFNKDRIRKKIVERGFKFWDRELFITDKAEYIIESLRAESGLPNSCLDQGDKIESIIVRTFQYLESYHVDEFQLVNIIAAIPTINYLPQVLQRESFYELISKLCVKLLELKREFQLDDIQNPIDYLSKRNVDWKDRLPLRVTGDEAEEFYNRLLSDVANVDKLEIKFPFNLQNILECDEEGIRINSRLEIQEGKYEAASVGIDIDNWEQYPNQLKLVFKNAELEFNIAYLAKTGDKKIISNNYKIDLPDLLETEWGLFLANNQGDILSEIDLPPNYLLSLDEPLVFSFKDEKWGYEGSGNIRIKEDRVRVIYRKNLDLSSEKEINEVGFINGSKVVESSSDCTLSDLENGEEFRIKIKQQTPTTSSIVLSHSRTNPGNLKIHSMNKSVFIGAPRIYSFNHTLGAPERFDGFIQKRINNGTWEDINLDNISGRLKLRFTDKDREVIGYKNVDILPEDLQIDINNSKHTIQLTTKENISVGLQGNIKAQASLKENNSYLLSFDDATSSDQSLFHTLVSFENGLPITLNLPNPRFIEIFSDPEDKIINNEKLVMGELAGYSIIINNYSEKEVVKVYRLTISDINNHELDSLSIKRTVKVKPGETKRVPLFKWKDDMARLFAMSESTGARVILKSELKNHQLEIQKYHCYGYIEEGFVNIQGEIYDNISLKAIPLSEKFEPSKVIKLSHSEDGYNLIEQIPNDGLWLCFSSKDSSSSMKPLPYVMGENVREYDDEDEIVHFSQTSLMPYSVRKKKLIDIFDSKFCQFDDPLWEELYTLWEATSHLPFDAHDVWKALVQSNKGMLTLMMSDYMEPSLIDGLAIQFNFNWRIVNINDWKEVLKNWFSSNFQKPYFQHFLSLKLDFIQDNLGFTLIKYLMSGEIEPVKGTEFRSSLEKLINGDFKKRIIGLRARNGHGTPWASYSSEFIKSKYLLLPESVKELIPAQFPDWQKPAIYTPIILAYHSIYGDLILPEEMDKQIELGLLLNSEFDVDYFEQAYKISQKYFYSNFLNK